MDIQYLDLLRSQGGGIWGGGHLLLQPLSQCSPPQAILQRVDSHSTKRTQVDFWTAVPVPAPPEEGQATQRLLSLSIGLDLLEGMLENDLTPPEVHLPTPPPDCDTNHSQFPAFRCTKHTQTDLSLKPCPSPWGELLVLLRKMRGRKADNAAI